MLEWLKRHAWKACVPQKGIASSNLALSAEMALQISVGPFSLKCDKKCDIFSLAAIATVYFNIGTRTSREAPDYRGRILCRL